MGSHPAAWLTQEAFREKGLGSGLNVGLRRLPGEGGVGMGTWRQQSEGMWQYEGTERDRGGFIQTGGVPTGGEGQEGFVHGHQIGQSEWTGKVG